jgi:hypothetical protein
MMLEKVKKAEHRLQVCCSAPTLVAKNVTCYVTIWIVGIMTGIGSEVVDVLGYSKCQDALGQCVKHDHKNYPPLTLLVKVKVTIVPEEQSYEAVGDTVCDQNAI